jgi:hypothetical protein
VVHEKVLRPEHPYTAISLSNLGWNLDNQGRHTEAERRTGARWRSTRRSSSRPIGTQRSVAAYSPAALTICINTSRRSRCIGRRSRNWKLRSANVLPSLLDDSRTVFVPGPLVSRDHGARLQRLDFIERGDPLASLLRTCLGQQLMNAIVGGVSGDHQSDGWHNRTVVSCVSVCPTSTTTKLCPSSLMTFPPSSSANHHSLGNLPRKPRVPPRFQYLG